MKKLTLLILILFLIGFIQEQKFKIYLAGDSTIAEDDNRHFPDYGAEVMARLVAEAISKLNLQISKFVNN